MPLQDCKWVWKNGKIVKWEDATVHVSAHGLHYGTGVFEGIRCYRTDRGPAVFRLKEHLERMFASAEAYAMKLPYSLDELASATRQVISKNEFNECYIRPIAFFGSSTLTVHPKTSPVDVAIFAWPWGAYLGESAHELGVNVTISPWRKFSSAAIPATAKACGQYLNSVLAVQDAVARGFDEALLLDDEGNLTEGSGENLFLVRKGKIYTNDQQFPVLMGITRDSVIQVARDLGYELQIGPLRPEDLMSADEAFFTGTAVEVTSIRAVDGKSIGAGKAGPVASALEKEFIAIATGRNKKYEGWLSYVETSTLAKA